MKFIDMFCGMGTIRMGFEKAGHECVYSIEFDKHKRKIYEVIFGNEPEGRDIRDVRGSALPISDCWCFGAPCQDFSIAGQRSGLSGDRSSLVREVFRLLNEVEEEHRPEWLLYENVKGMLSSNKGLDYLEILCEMGSLGYDIEWQLLNSKNFGVPQNRERVYTIGHLRRYGEQKIFPIGGTDKKVDADINVLAHRKGYRRNTQVYSPKGSTKALDTCQGGGREPHVIISKSGKLKENNTAEQYASCLTAGGHSGGNHSDMDLIVEPTIIGFMQAHAKISTNGICPTITQAMGKGGGQIPMITEPRACLTPNRLKKRQNGRRFKEPGEPMYTLTKQDVHGVMIPEATKKGYAEACEGDSINLAMLNSKTRRGRVGKGVANTLDTSCNQATLCGSRIRRLTPRECMRLQGVPDYITDKLINAGISDTQMYRAAGDACTVNVVYEIAKRLEVIV